jgi:hypothetical protein
MNNQQQLSLRQKAMLIIIEQYEGGVSRAQLEEAVDGGWSAY